MRHFVIAFLLIASVNAKDVSKADSQKSPTNNQQAAPENPSTRIEINVGNPYSATASQPQEQHTIPQPKPAPISNGEWLIAGITAVYALISFFTFLVIRKQLDAAQKTVTVMVNSERSWVMADIEWQPGSHIFESTEHDGRHNTGIYVNYICRNVGRTFAQITAKGYVFRVFADHPPVKPDFSDIQWFQFTSKYLKPADADDTYQLSGIFCTKTYEKTLGSLMLLYGRVDYRDIYGEHETVFGYMITPNGDLVRLPHDTFPEYNKNA